MSVTVLDAQQSITDVKHGMPWPLLFAMHLSVTL